MSTPIHTAGELNELSDSQVAPSSLASVSPILRVANEIEAQRPRVAYLCRFQAFRKAHRIDPTSSGCGVLIMSQHFAARHRQTDAQEIQSYYQQYYNDCVKAPKQPEHSDRAQLAKAYQTAPVLFEVLKAVNRNKAEEQPPQIIAAADVDQKMEIHAPINVLRVDAVAGTVTKLFDSEVVPSSLASMKPILRVAIEIEAARPRVAYLCRYQVFEKPHRIDPTSSGRGVRQFKTALLQRLEKDNEPTLAARPPRSDAQEFQGYYQQCYNDYVKALEQPEHSDRGQLAKAYRTAAMLFEVLRAGNGDKVEEPPPEVNLSQMLSQCEFVTFCATRQWGCNFACSH